MINGSGQLAKELVKNRYESNLKIMKRVQGIALYCVKMQQDKDKMV